MLDMPDKSVESFFLLTLLVTVVFYSVWRFIRKKKAVKAAEVFKEKILSELKGLYPVPRYIDKDAFQRFTSSIPVVQAAAAPFRKHVPRSSRKSFDTALDEYCKICRDISWEDCVAFKILPGERKPQDEGPREIFRQKVNALLSFTKK